MLDAAVKALSQILSPPMRSILWRSIGMALVSLDGRFLRVNRALCQIVGYDPEELVRMRFQDITHPEDLESDMEQVERLLRGEIDRYRLAKRYLRKNGSIVDVLLNASIVRDREGAPVHFIAQVEDVTDRRRTEQALLASERLLRGLYENALDAIVLSDSAGIILTRQSTNYKGRLQELLQQRTQTTPLYRILRQSGPPHNRHFIIEVVHQGEQLGRGSGPSKRTAEQAAARDALEQLGEEGIS